MAALVPGLPPRAYRKPGGGLVYVPGIRREEDDDLAYRGRAAFYGLYLREICGYSPREAAECVLDRYPQARPWLEKLRRSEPPRPSPPA